MNRLLKKVFIVFAVFALCGCVRIRMNLDVSSSGNIKGGMTLLIQDQYLNIGGASGSELIGSLIEQYSKEYPGSTVKEMHETEGDVSYSGISVSGFRSEEMTAVKEDGQLVLHIPVSQVADALASAAGNMGSIDLDTLKNYGAELTLNVSMPNAVTCNVGTVNGRTVTIDLLNLPAGTEEITVSCRAGMPAAVLIGIGIAVAAAAGGVYYAVRKKNEA